MHLRVVLRLLICAGSAWREGGLGRVSEMGSRFRLVNIEKGMPSVDQARDRLADELRRASRDGVKVMKIIHGYGSTGVGGKLREALRKSLKQKVKLGQIKGIVVGEDWGIFEPLTRQCLDCCPELRRDPDLERGNPGITVILL